MALAVRASASAKVVSTRRVQPRAARASVRAAAISTNQIAAGVATVATAAFAAAPAEAHNMVMTLADQPYAGAWLSTVLVPLTGLLFPGMAMASLFLYISKNKA